mmetsp:Transcript_101876/g.317552  ORF Transcript_101876/g.317552 Transcript_101876/m.317552 type:complete len:329 (-) Transcript_101876:813-1799(-)
MVERARPMQVLGELGAELDGRRPGLQPRLEAGALVQRRPGGVAQELADALGHVDGALPRPVHVALLPLAAELPDHVLRVVEGRAAERACDDEVALHPRAPVEPPPARAAGGGDADEVPATAARGEVAEELDPLELQLGADGPLRLAVEVEHPLRELLRQEVELALLDVVLEVRQARRPGNASVALVELAHRGLQQRLVDLKERPLPEPHAANRQVEALVDRGIAEAPPHRLQLLAVVEVVRKPCRLPRAVVQLSHLAHLQAQPVPLLGCLREHQARARAEKFLATDGPNDHMNGEHGLLLCGAQPILAAPRPRPSRVGRLIASAHENA